MEMVKDMNKTTKELISEYLADQTKKFDLVHADAFTTVAIVSCFRRENRKALQRY